MTNLAVRQDGTTRQVWLYAQVCTFTCSQIWNLSPNHMQTTEAWMLTLEFLLVGSLTEPYLDCWHRRTHVHGLTFDMMQPHLTMPEIDIPLAVICFECWTPKALASCVSEQCECIWLPQKTAATLCLLVSVCPSLIHSHFWPDPGWRVPLLKLQGTSGVFVFNGMAERCSCNRVSDKGRQNRIIRCSACKRHDSEYCLRKHFLSTFPADYIFMKMLVLMRASSNCSEHFWNTNANHSTTRLLTKSRHGWLSEFPAAISHRLILNWEGWEENMHCTWLLACIIS